MRNIYLALAFASAFALPVYAAETSSRPNVLLIVGDDIGFSDIGCYGSEIRTPNLDRLGANGLRFTQFYNMSKCETTRSALFTGLYEKRPNVQNALAFPQLMREAGYYAAMSGKEHFKNWVPDRCYGAQCFDDSFVYWMVNTYFVPPNGEFEYPFKLNGRELKTEEIEATRKPLYKTDFVTDYALRFLEKAEQQDKPFLLYLPLHPGHFPLQARPEDIAKYRGKYKKGWDLVRQERFERQKQLGVIPADCELSLPEDNINKFRGPYRDSIYKYRPWDTLTEEEQDELDLEMAVFAAMIDRLDQNIGRVLQKLEEMGEMDNTLILFFSDNGSCPYDSNRDFSIPPGGPDSYRTLCAAWANVGNTPFRFYKQYGHEGGCRSPFIAYWPGKISSGFCNSPAHLVDIFPTMLELAGAQYPESISEGVTPKLDGESIVPLLMGKDRNTPDFFISGFSDRFRSLRSGDWKIVRVNEGPWELYNMRNDMTELHNLAESYPEKAEQLEKLLAEYENKTAE